MMQDVKTKGKFPHAGRRKGRKMPFLSLPGDLDLWPWPSHLSERGTEHVFRVNLAQIRSAVSEIFHTQTKKHRLKASKQNLPQFTACGKNNTQATRVTSPIGLSIWFPCIFRLTKFTRIAAEGVAISKSQIPLRYPVADRFEDGRRPAASWNLAYHLAC